MKRLVLLIVLAGVSVAPQAAADKDVAGWEKQAQGITIIRDDWGIAARLRQDRRRRGVRRDLRAGRGRLQPRRDELHQLAWAAWPKPRAKREIYRDLRMKLFIDPDDMKAQYADEPGVAEGADERVGRRAELLPRTRIPT